MLIHENFMMNENFWGVKVGKIKFMNFYSWILYTKALSERTLICVRILRRKFMINYLSTVHTYTHRIGMYVSIMIPLFRMMKFNCHNLRIIIFFFFHWKSFFFIIYRLLAPNRIAQFDISPSTYCVIPFILFIWLYILSKLNLFLSWNYLRHAAEESSFCLIFFLFSKKKNIFAMPIPIDVSIVLFTVYLSRQW